MSKFVHDDQVMTRTLITPEVAKGFLGGMYEKQRKKRNAYVQAYAADMREGNWNPNNPAPIVISKDGKCIDGQHRLLAIVETGIPCLMWVCYGVSNDVYDFIDSGHPRLLSDRGIDMPMVNQCCALARRVVAMDKGTPLSTAIKGGGNVTQQQIMERLAADRDHILTCVRHAEGISRAIGKGGNTFFALPLYMADVIYGDGTSESLKEKISEPSTSVMTLQKQVLKMYSGNVKPHGIDVVPVFICFCDAALNGRTVRSFAKKDECASNWERAYRSVVDDAR